MGNSRVEADEFQPFLSRGTVIQVVDTLRIGGAERMAVDVSNCLSDRGWNVVLVATRESGPLDADLHPNVKLVELDRRSRFDIDGIRQFRRLVGALKPEVIHAHGWSSLQFCTAALLCMWRPPPLAFHDHRGSGLKPLNRSYRTTAWLQTRAHIAVDRALLEPPLKTRLPSVSLAVQNGTPSGRFLRKVNYALTMQPRLIALANLRREKDHPTLIRAVKWLSDSGIECTLDLVGSLPDKDYEKECRQLVEDLGLGPAVRFLGSRSDTATELATYDLGVLSSQTESGPIALIEYLFAGLPFVVTDVGDIPACLPEDLKYWLTPPEDHAFLGNKIENLLTLSAEERRGLAEKGNRFAQTRLSIDRTVDAIEGVYAQISHSPRS